MANRFTDENGLLYLAQRLKEKLVQKETGKGLSTNDFTNELKEKLTNIEDYELPTATNTVKGGIIVGDNLTVDENGRVSATAMSWSNITDKPTIPNELSDLTDDATHRLITDAERAAWNAKSEFSGSYKDLTDVPTDFASSQHTHEQSDINGLEATLSGKAAKTHTHLSSEITDFSTEMEKKANVEHTHEQSEVTGLETTLAGKADKSHKHASSDISDFATEMSKKANATHTHAQSEVTGLESALSDINVAIGGKVETSVLAQPNGVATLDGNGIIPSTQLPSYVDDVVEGYYKNGKFYTDSAYANLVTPDGGVIYIDMDTNISYRYGGTVYVPITSSDMTAITNSEIDEIVASVFA